MAGKYLAVPDQYPAGNDINTPDQFRDWLKAKCQQEMIGTQQSAIQKLTQEWFTSFDMPKTNKHIFTYKIFVSLFTACNELPTCFIYLAQLVDLFINHQIIKSSNHMYVINRRYFILHSYFLRMADAQKELTAGASFSLW
jgi:hypothetical protein